MTFKSLFYLSVLASCAATTSCARSHSYGNYTTRTPKVVQQRLAGHAARIIREGEAPARTILHFEHSNRDAFGRQLSNELTREGFGVVDHTGPSSKAEKRVRYILDEIEPGILRLTLGLDGTEYSQVYVVSDDLEIQAGDWTKRKKPSNLQD